MEPARSPLDEFLRDRLGDQYKLEAVLGEGGMGAVYLARDLKHSRRVAIKTVRPDAATDEFRKRFEREIAITAHLQHRHILPLLDSGLVGDTLYYVMPFVDGESLEERLERGDRLSIEEAIDIGCDVSEALGHAHDHDVIHRDVKPGNILLTADYALVADFGIGKELGQLEDKLTRTGGAVGSVHYMAPEQFRGEATPQSDIYGLGAVLFEGLTGRSWFAAARQPDPGWDDCPLPIRSVLRRALKAAPEQRWPDAAAFRDALNRAARPPSQRRTARARRWVAGSATVAVAVAAWIFYGRYRSQWAYEVALPQIERLLVSGDHAGALALAEEAETYIRGDSALSILWPRIARRMIITTDPPGGTIAMAAVERPARSSEARVVAMEQWSELGRAPIEIDRLPIGSYRMRAWASGRDTAEVIYWLLYEERGGPARKRLLLPPAGTAPPGMIVMGSNNRVANLFGLPGDYDPTPNGSDDPPFLLGKYEVTNREYKTFVDAGGYSDQAYWRHAFRDNSRTLAWEDAMTELVDRSGRPGPSTWEGGTYPEDVADHPVGGVSWYEAAAYAEFAGLSLPTVYHWQAAAKYRGFNMAGFGNYRGEGPSAVGAAPFGPFGVRDLAGNVREWAWNRAGDLRYILGGGWSDPYYVYEQGAVAPPLDRSARNGFRLADYLETTDAELEALHAPIEGLWLDFVWGGKAVDDGVFEVLAAQYAYDEGDVGAAVDSVHDSSPYWRREFVSFDAAYGGERVLGHLFLPKGVDPPFQTLIFFPGAGSIRDVSSHRLDGEDMIDHVVKSGRAVLHPIYKDTYERHVGLGQNRGPTNTYVARKTRWIQDVRRSIDYLDTRSDIDGNKIGYWGLSWGAEHAPIALATDPRLRTGILMDGGALHHPVLPAADESNFAPRVDVPVLMINGRYDFIFPLELSQRPLFDLLGTPEGEKRHVLFNSGHVAAGSHFDEVMAEVVSWLDRILGRVR